MESEKLTRIATTFVTRSGRVFDIANPQPEDVLLGDIAHALAHLCRYGGHTPGFYSVAQHSVLVARACRLLFPGDEYSSAEAIMTARWGLFHDASEAYLGDVIWPLKKHPALAPYKELEHGVMRAVATRFGLPLAEPPIVNWADRCVLLAETRDFFGDPDWAHCRVGGSVGDNRVVASAGALGTIVPLAPVAAKAAFLHEAMLLGVPL